MAMHLEGYVHSKHPLGDSSLRSISTPRTKVTDGDDGLRIPQSMPHMLRECLRDVYPDLAKKPFSGTRICWYTDSLDDDWVIGFLPSDPGVVMATSGSGHAFKFLPIIGNIVAGVMTGLLTAEDVKRFAPHRSPPSTQDQEHKRHMYRNNRKPQELNINELCTPEDLLP